MPLNRDTTYQIFEYACHEGNYVGPPLGLSVRTAGHLRTRPSRTFNQVVDLPSCRPGPWSKTRKAG